MRASALIRQGYLLRIVEDLSVSPHVFAGPSSVEGGNCPNCEKALLHMLSIKRDAAELNKTPVTGEGTIPLLFCWTCEIADGVLIYRVRRGGREIELLQFSSGDSFDDFPYANYPVYFPRKGVLLEPLPEQDQALIQELNGGDAETLARFDETHRHLTIPRHQLGGEPYLFDPEALFACPGCGDPMQHLATLGDESGGERGFAGNRYVQTVFHLCPRCLAVAAFQRSE